MMPPGRGRGTLPGVTHASHDHAAATTGHASPWLTALAVAFLVLCMLMPTGVIIYTARRARRALRICRVCGGDAIRQRQSESAGIMLSSVSLQCGQCGVWRQLRVNEADAQAHGRRLERETRHIRRSMLQLEGERRVLEMRAFIGLLRTSITGADDFLASTRPPSPMRRARPPQNRRDQHGGSR